MGQGLGAVLPIVVIGIVADLLVQLLLRRKVVGRGAGGWCGLARGWGHGFRGHGGTRAGSILGQPAQP